MTTKPHPAHIFNTIEELVAYWCGDLEGEARIKPERIARKIWKKHIEKHGNVPLIRKCTICSGAEHKMDIKLGKWKVSTRTEQDEKNNILNEQNNEET